MWKHLNQWQSYFSQERNYENMATNWCEIQPKYPLDINQDDISLTILRTRIPLKPLQKNFFLVDRSLFTFRWTDWKFRTLLVWSNLVASGPIPLLFPTEIIWELPLHTAAITSSRGSSPHLTTKPSINKRPTLEQSLFLLGWQLN